MRKPETRLRYVALISILPIIGILFLGWLSSWDSGGSEQKVIDVAPALSDRLRVDFGYENFKSEWLKKAWVNGFREHTFLYLVVPDSTSLKVKLKGNHEMPD